MKVLFAAGEALPFAASGGLGEVTSALPAALRRRFVGARVILPLYDTIPQALRENMKYLTNFFVPLGWRNQYCGVFEAHVGGVTYYLLDNEYYFKRGRLYGFYDDGERFAFFSRAVLETLRHIDWYPDILHAHDWHAAMVPVYYDYFYRNVPEYSGIRTVFTIHNIEYQGKFDRYVLGELFGMDVGYLPIMEYDGCLNLMKAAVTVSDRVTTVSPRYAWEILDPWYSHGMHHVLRFNQYKLSGILNGIDTTLYNPAADPDVWVPFDADDFSGKAENKRRLQEEFGLEQRPDVPVIALVTRLVEHKGLDLVRAVLEKMLEGAQIVVLGSGDRKYEEFFSDMAARHPGRFGLRLGFIPSLAHKIYAGADLFLMPSKSEPCGLSQMIALRYGTVPIVRETGGLADSIRDCGNGEGNGFTFKNYDAYDMLDAFNRAMRIYYDEKEYWQTLVQRALRCDFSWKRSAGEYLALYKSLLAPAE